MDAVLRTYAHTAWTPADPLQGLDPDLRLGVLLMPSTFRERLRMAPWTSYAQRREAMAEILAERRLMLELTTHKLERLQPAPARSQEKTGEGTGAPSGGVGPYYQYRLGLHRQALETVHATRQEQDLLDLEKSPEAAQDALRRAAVRRQLADIIQERARLDLKELRILEGREVEATSLAKPRKDKRRSRDR